MTASVAAAAATSTPEETVELVVRLPRGAVEALDQLAEKGSTPERRKTKTEVLREAIALKTFVEEELAKGWRLMLERGGETREVTFTS